MSGAPRRPRSAGIAVACISLLFVLLPALVVGSSLAAPARPGEAARLQRALSSAELAAAADGQVARAYYLSAAPVAVWPTTAAEQATLLGRARLTQALAIGAISGLLYLVVLMARGRLQALVACAALAALPPVVAEGQVLRPEVPAVLFAALALQQLLTLAAPPRVLVLGSRQRRHLLLAGVAGCAMFGNGLCVATLPSFGVVLLVPGVVLTVAAVQIGWRGSRVGRRRGWLRVPVPAMNRRLLPWTALSLLTPAVAWYVLSRSLAGPVEALAPSQAGVGLLPEAFAGRVAWLAVAVLGAIAGLLRVGIRFGRGGRIGADLVLFVFTVVLLAGAVRLPPGEDALGAALPFAVLAADGVRALLVAVSGSWRRRAAGLRPSSAARSVR